jgi:hypothetical protein
MIANEQGLVAVKYVTTIPHTVKMGERMYYFVVRARINLCWVYPEDTEAIFKLKRRDCHCGNPSTRPEYFPANEMDVRRWTNNGGR